MTVGDATAEHRASVRMIRTDPAKTPLQGGRKGSPKQPTRTLLVSFPGERAQLSLDMLVDAVETWGEAAAAARAAALLSWPTAPTTDFEVTQAIVGNSVIRPQVHPSRVSKSELHAIVAEETHEESNESIWQPRSGSDFGKELVKAGDTISVGTEMKVAPPAGAAKANRGGCVLQ